MAAVTRDTSFKPVSPVHSHSYVDVEDDANEIYAGAFVQQTATGRLVIVDDTGGLGAGPVVGVNERNVPDQAGLTYSGPLERPTAKVYQGLFERPFATSNPPSDADMLKAVYAANNHDVTTDSTKPLLGIMVGINNEAETCTVLVSGANRALSAQHLGSIAIAPGSWYLAAGTPLAAFADGVSPTPGLSLSDSKAAGVRWNNDAAPGQIVTSIALPDSLDSERGAYLIFAAAKTGTPGNTLADAPTLGIEAFFAEVGALYDADDDAGGVTNAMVGDVAAKTVQTLALLIDAANIPSGTNRTLTLTLQPEAGKLGTDDLILLGSKLVYSTA